MAQHQIVTKTKQDLEMEKGIEESVKEVQSINLDDIGEEIKFNWGEKKKVMAVIIGPDNKKLVLYDNGHTNLEAQGGAVKVFMEWANGGRVPGI